MISTSVSIFKTISQFLRYSADISIARSTRSINPKNIKIRSNAIRIFIYQLYSIHFYPLISKIYRLYLKPSIILILYHSTNSHLSSQSITLIATLFEYIVLWLLFYAEILCRLVPVIYD